MNAKKIMAMILAVVLLMTATIAGTIAWLTDDSEIVTNTFTVGDINIELDEKDVDNSDRENDRDLANKYKIIPGDVSEKDPRVTVKAGSEACYVFVEVTEKYNTVADKTPTKYIEWNPNIGNGEKQWTELVSAKTEIKDENNVVVGYTYVYYTTQESLVGATAGAEYYVLAGNKTYKNGMVSYSSDLSKADIEALYQKETDGSIKVDANGNPVLIENMPTLTFKAYAIQQANIVDADNPADGVIDDAWEAVKAESNT